MVDKQTALVQTQKQNFQKQIKERDSIIENLKLSNKDLKNEAELAKQNLQTHKSTLEV